MDTREREDAVFKLLGVTVSNLPLGDRRASAFNQVDRGSTAIVGSFPTDYRRLHLNVRSDIRNSTSPADESRIVVADTIKVGETFVRKISESRTKSVHSLERV